MIWLDEAGVANLRRILYAASRDKMLPVHRRLRRRSFAERIARLLTGGTARYK